MVLIQQIGKHGEATVKQSRFPLSIPRFLILESSLIWKYCMLAGANDSLGNGKVSYLSASPDAPSTLPQLH